MHTDANPEAHRCCGACRLNRRQFLAVGSGLVGAVAAASAAPAKKTLPSVELGPLKKFAQDAISEDFLDHNFFVIRYQGKLFAASIRCPHQGHELSRDSQDATRITCGSHGSVFDHEGAVVVGPATSGLIRLGISVNPKGNVVVNPNKKFPQDKWEEKGAFVEIP